MLRDFPWLQFYCETNQEVLDTTLLAFRLAEDHRVLLPTLVAMDAFVVSHTMAETRLPEQWLVDSYLPDLALPHRMRHEKPTTMGGLAWPHETVSQRIDVDEAMQRVPTVFEESRLAFEDAFGRDPGGAIQTFETEDADTILVATGTIATTAREIVRRRRDQGERVGLLKIKMFRPFPEAAIRQACHAASRVGVLDRNYAAGMGGVFWQDLRAAFQGYRDDLMIQDYLTGVGGGDVTPGMINEVIADLALRSKVGPPIWMGVDTREKVH